MALAHDLLLAIINGVTWGIIIALTALGLNFIFGLLEIVNIAHGAFYMSGAVIGWFVIDATGSFWVGLLVAPLAVALFGVGIERVVLRPIENDLNRTVIATFGLMLVFQQLALLTFGSATRLMSAPIQGSLGIGPISYPLYRLAIAVFAVLVMAGLHVFLQRTKQGLWMRGVRQRPEIAQSLGVPTNRVYALTFGIGSFFAGLAGILAAPIVSVHYLMGLEILAVAFIVVVVGGLGSFGGVLVASILFALIQNVATLGLPSTQAKILAFVLLGSLLLIRPEGIFGDGDVVRPFRRTQQRLRQLLAG